METKELFNKSYNSFRNEYRILETEKSNGINKTLFFDRVGALTIARQNKLNAPLYTFELYPYKPYWIYQIYWVFLKWRRNKRKRRANQPTENPNKKRTISSLLLKYLEEIIIGLIIVIIGILIERGKIDIGI
ncbi:hypothetical protein OS188_14620 [Xanthomarina sp. F1114]|uniref:hypothetical protein n=1 Tax=Xanthomarina sp. F1114 TaxID=2996019 RepID=UPI00225E2AA0|nr:hypothetical protein [Xanthomarina sp. F1114]MCX7549188.1 hypothetical protein [Xanthomarina sp. F1114]